MFGKCVEASHISMVNDSRFLRISIYSLSFAFTTFTKEMCEASQHLPNIYHENVSFNMLRPRFEHAPKRPQCWLLLLAKRPWGWKRDSSVSFLGAGPPGPNGFIRLLYTPLCLTYAAQAGLEKDCRRDACTRCGVHACSQQAWLQRQSQTLAGRTQKEDK